MRFVRLFLITATLSFEVFAQAQPKQESQPQPAPASPQTIIRAEKQLVLVDAIVTDKKGDYIRDLTAKEFRVWEDNKEQTIESFSFEAESGPAASARKRYLILFFDNSTMQFGEQAQARKAAMQFIEHNAGPNREIAVVNFTGALQIAQNFTEDSDRLKQAVNGIKISSVSPNGDLGMPQLGRAAADFGARDVLLALRTLAKSLASIPGRKTLVFMTGGFALNTELRSELPAVIDACNKANVAIYAIDVRGLVAAKLNLPREVPAGSPAFRTEATLPGGATLQLASYIQPATVSPQRGTTGAGQAGGTSSAGGRGGIGAGGRTGAGMAGTGARGGMSPGMGTRGMGNNPAFNPLSRTAPIIPHIPNVANNQEVMYALATGTGGFVIANTNDLLAGLDKIGKEQNEYYVLGYSPAELKEGSCHELKVKVDRGGTNIRARSGYCTAKPLDLLAGTAAEKELENRAKAGAAGNIPASVESAFFYTAPNTARVTVAMDIASAALQFEKEKGKQHSEVNVLGIAYDLQGDVAARFSDTVKLDLENKKAVEEFRQKPLHYEKQFDIASGQYNLRVVFSAGGNAFGRMDTPLQIEPYDPGKFALSGVALSQELKRVSDLDVGLDAILLEDKKPLVSQGMEITPSGSNVFAKSQPAVVYVEIYEPLLAAANTPKVGLQMRLIDKKTGQQKLDTGFLSVAPFAKAGNPVIPVGMKLPVDTLAPGAYRAEFKAIDTAGNSSTVRAADFEVQ